MTRKDDMEKTELKPCINFSGHINTNGYGYVRLFGRQRLAHVVAFKMANPKVIICNKCVCHKCDNRTCINPEHLFLGTRIENNKDRDNKGRQVSVYGENNGMSKLKKDDIAEIRYRLSKKESFASIGRVFKVRWQTIQAIARGKTWKTK
jgi:hypothetical protein